MGFGLPFYNQSLIGHWDAMDQSSIVRNESGYIDLWTDKMGNFDLKSAGQSHPKYVSEAIHGNPAVDFTGYDIGLISDVKYMRLSNQPFTCIMVVKPTSDDLFQHIFTVTSANWTESGIGTDYFPIVAMTNGIFVFDDDLHAFDKVVLEKDFLQIYTVRYDGSKLIASIGIPDSNNQKPVNLDQERAGYIKMGRNYTGLIGEMLLYDAALEFPVITNLIHLMSKKWTTGIQWKKPGKDIIFKSIRK